MGRFNWAPEFMRLNGAMLDDYSKAKDSTEVVRIQNEYIKSVTGGNSGSDDSSERESRQSNSS